MSTQSINESYTYYNGTYCSYSDTSTSNSSTKSRTSDSDLQTSETYSSEKLLSGYSNSDGDTLSLSAESLDYQTTKISDDDDNSKDSRQSIVDKIKSEYADLLRLFRAIGRPYSLKNIQNVNHYLNHIASLEKKFATK